MRKIIAPGLLGLGLLTLSALAAQAGFDRIDRIYPHIPPGKDSISKTINLDITGILLKVSDFRGLPREQLAKDFRRPMPMPFTWQISAAGKVYELDFSANPELAGLAEKLNGKAVRLSGRLVERLRLHGLEQVEPARIIVPQPHQVIEVAGLQSAETIRETVTVEIRTTLRYEEGISRALEGGPRLPRPRPWEGHFVVVDGKHHRLDFAANTALANLAHKLTDTPVVLIADRFAERPRSANRSCVALLPPKSAQLIVLD